MAVVVPGTKQGNTSSSLGGSMAQARKNQTSPVSVGTSTASRFGGSPKSAQSRRTDVGHGQQYFNSAGRQSKRSGG